MGKESISKDRRVQKEKPSLAWYLSYFGTTEIFESKCADDLNKKFTTHPRLKMTDEVYQKLIKYAEKEVAEWMEEIFNKGLDQDDIDECKTPEELEQLIKDNETMKAMSPREFWMLFNGPKN